MSWKPLPPKSVTKPPGLPLPPSSLSQNIKEKKEVPAEFKAQLETDYEVGSGREIIPYVKIYRKGELTYFNSCIGCEWVPDALMQAYAWGREDASEDSASVLVELANAKLRLTWLATSVQELEKKNRKLKNAVEALLQDGDLPE